MIPLKSAALGLGHTLWRQLPRDFRRRGMSGLAAALARKPDRPGPSRSNGIIVAGDTEGANGLAESARIMHAVIAAHGMARGLVPLGLPSVVPAVQVDVPKDAALLAVLNAPILPVGLLRHRRDFIAGRRVIGMWAWELPVLPGDWRYGAKFVHEIWAPSQFTADAVEILAPGRVRVVPYPLAALPEMKMAGDRASFNLPADALVVLTIFNLASSMARKNPLGNIAAFKAAFGLETHQGGNCRCTEYPSDFGNVAGAAIARADRGQRYCTVPAPIRRVRPDTGNGDAAGPAGGGYRMVRKSNIHDARDIGSRRLPAGPGGRPARQL